MSEPLLQIGAEGVSVDRIVEEIRAEVQRKTDLGVYADPRVARAERANLARFRNEDELLQYHLSSLRESSFVDINDFDIRERRAGLGPLLVGLKRSIWKLLKFYTYRLWSQQNDVNGLLVTALDEIDARNRGRIQELEERVRKLESRLPPAP